MSREQPEFGLLPPRRRRRRAQPPSDDDDSGDDHGGGSGGDDDGDAAHARRLALVDDLIAATRHILDVDRWAQARNTWNAEVTAIAAAGGMTEQELYTMTVDWRPLLVLTSPLEQQNRLDGGDWVARIARMTSRDGPFTVGDILYEFDLNLDEKEGVRGFTHVPAHMGQHAAHAWNANGVVVTYSIRYKPTTYTIDSRMGQAYLDPGFVGGGPRPPLVPFMPGAGDNTMCALWLYTALSHLWEHWSNLQHHLPRASADLIHIEVHGRIAVVGDLVDDVWVHYSNDDPWTFEDLSIDLVLAFILNPPFGEQSAEMWAQTGPDFLVIHSINFRVHRAGTLQVDVLQGGAEAQKHWREAKIGMKSPEASKPDYLVKLAKSRSVVQIVPSGSIGCLPLALVVLRAYKQMVNNKLTRTADDVAQNPNAAFEDRRHWAKMRRAKSSLQVREARTLAVLAKGGSGVQSFASMADLVCFATALEHDIVLFTHGANEVVKVFAVTRKYVFSKGGGAGGGGGEEEEEEKGGDGDDLPLLVGDIPTAVERLVRMTNSCEYYALYYTQPEFCDNPDGKRDIGHVDCILNVLPLLGKICKRCGKGYKERHNRCSVKCPFCKVDGCTGGEDRTRLRTHWAKHHPALSQATRQSHGGSVATLCDMLDINPPITLKFADMLLKCGDCRVSFPTPLCFRNHKEAEFSNRKGHSGTVCSSMWRCKDACCGNVVFTTPEANALKGLVPADTMGPLPEGVNRHIHGNVFFCRKCKLWTKGRASHFCDMPVLAPKPATQSVWFADFEAQIQPDGQHKVNYAVAQRTSWPSVEVEEEVEFFSGDAFCAWLLKSSHFGSTFVFHNGRSYDFHFVRLYILRRESNWNLNCLRRGMKLTSMTAGPKSVTSQAKNVIHFIDSLSFLTSSLASLARTYGLKDKGYFPHRFNSIEHEAKWATQKTLPAQEYFFGNSDSSFQRWWSHNEHKPWDFWGEMARYCKNDVDILRQVFHTFRVQIFDDCGVDPLHAPTLPAMTTKIFFTKFYTDLKMVTLNTELTDFARRALFGGRTNAVCLRKNATKCGVCTAMTTCLREDKKLMMAVYSDTSGHSEFEDVCLKCFSRCWGMRISGGLTKNIASMLCVSCVGVSFDAQIALATLGTCFPPLVKSGDPCTCPEKILYYDVTSLYPSVLVKNYFPLREPDEVKVAATPVQQLVKRYLTHAPTGTIVMMECDVVPPTDLYFPVLPSHGGGVDISGGDDLPEDEDEYAGGKENDQKLMFHLYPQSGVWTTPELLSALKRGYEITSVKRLLHWGPEKTSNKFFSPYILYFLKRKTCANGWKKILGLWIQKLPRRDQDRLSTCSLEAKWLEYCYAYNTYYTEYCGYNIPADVRMTLSDLPAKARDASAYATWKLCLNSLWGRFCMRRSFWNYTLFKKNAQSANAFLKMVNDDKLTTNWTDLLPGMVEVKHRPTDPKDRAIPNFTNIMVGVLTTAYARSDLYEALAIVGRRTLYHDTDSLIFHQRTQDEIPLPLGDFLGQFTDELDEGEHITSYMAAGPKNYALTSNLGVTALKCKGFNIKKAFVKKKISMDVYNTALDQVSETLNTKTEPIQVTFDASAGQGVIKRDALSRIYTTNATKSWRVYYTKRKLYKNVLNGEPYTLPWGFDEFAN